MTSTAGIKENPPPVESGVQDLINRIRDEGVAKGEQSSSELIAAARKEAAKILDDARRQAEELISQAQKDSQRLIQSAEAAVRIAIRDATVMLNENLRGNFAAKLQKLVAHKMQDRQFLEKVILAVSQRTAELHAGNEMEVILPARILSAEEIAANPEELKSSASEFVLDTAGEVLREGLTFTTSSDDMAGIRIRLQEEQIEIELTDRSVTDLLMAHLGPRFRALMNAGST